MKRKIFIVWLCVLIFTANVFAQANLKKWQTFDFSKKIVTKPELAKLELEDLGKLRGIVFGKRGRIFKEQTIQNYLARQAWYKPNPNFSNDILTANERRNIDLIREAEAIKHDFIQPGDLRFWEKKKIAEENLSPNTAAEWSVLIAEMEAIHGKTFADEPWLQKYFEDRYWYKPNPNYDPSVLSEIDRKNLTTIRTARDKQRKVAVSPGDMDKFQNVLLSEKMLEGATLNELRIMRNEFFARHGKTFSTPGYRAFYMWQDWYKPVKDQSKIKLNPIEEQNVKTIESYENKIREQLATQPVTEDLFEGLFAEDLRMLRNEIYARHGRIFKDVKLQKSFTEMSWYKPNPDFKDEMLSEVESKNLKAIADAEKLAESKFTEIEG
ncbi:MAG: YARHG domain-containing protein [Pyrinomonadaceae bacterium]